MIMSQIEKYERLSCEVNIFLIFSFQARQINIQNLQPFYSSDIFKANNFTLDAKRKLIIQQF